MYVCTIYVLYKHAHMCAVYLYVCEKATPHMHTFLAVSLRGGGGGGFNVCVCKSSTREIYLIAARDFMRAPVDMMNIFALWKDAYVHVCLCVCVVCIGRLAWIEELNLSELL